jgi:hypothetical protein
VAVLLEAGAFGFLLVGLLAQGWVGWHLARIDTATRMERMAGAGGEWAQTRALANK